MPDKASAIRGGFAIDRFESGHAAALALRPDSPVYCFRPSVLTADAKAFVEGFPGKTAYAVKTNGEDFVLRALVRAHGRIKSRDTLLDEVWGRDCDANDRTVDTHIKTLRAKLRERLPNLDPIATHRGLGYSLTWPPAGPPLR